jgi:hypothetical protein
LRCKPTSARGSNAWLVLGLGLGLAAVAFASSRAARADQDDVRVPLPDADALFSEETGFLTRSTGQADLAVYPVLGRGYHRWHGRLRGDIAIAQPSADSLVRLGLSVQTVADDRNEIAFRLVRVYYDAFTGYEHRLGPGIAYAGYRHRCSHGADAAVAGRVLIRSGPELGYRLTHALGDFSLGLHAFGHASLIAQNADFGALPRALFAGAGEARFRTGWVSLVAAAGLGGAIVGRSNDFTVTLGERFRGLRLEPLPAAALGAFLHGERAIFRALLHYQRMLDTGIGGEADPKHLLSLQLGFDY